MNSSIQVNLSAVCLKFLIYLSVIGCPVSLCAGDSEDHGFVQLSKFVSDRPIASVVQTIQGPVKVDLNSDMFLYISKLFTLDDDKPVFWDPSLPQKQLQYIGDHDVPTDKQKGKIRVREEYKDSKGLIRKVDFETSWYVLIFELHNIQSFKKYYELYNKSINEGISKKEWVRQNAMIEYDALIRVNEFYTTRWKPWMQTIKYEREIPAWGVNRDCKFHDWFAVVRKGNNYRYWDDYYDKYLSKYYKRR